MSTWTGINGGNPDSITSTSCRWPLCTAYVPQRFHKEGVHLCREHALLVWMVVNDQLTGGEPLEEEQEPEQPQQIPRIGYVYYVRTGGRIKIGYTTQLSRRLAQYPPDVEILYVKSGTKTLETTEHQRFRAYLAEGREWFQDRPEVTEPILEMAAKSATWPQFLEEEGDWWRRRTAQRTVSMRGSD